MNYTIYIQKPVNKPTKQKYKKASQLNYKANQLTGFYMIQGSVLKCFKQFMKYNKNDTVKK